MKFSLIPVAALAGVSSGLDAICHLPLDVMFLQDTTGSFKEDIPIVREQIPGMVSEIQGAFPGTKFGVAEFRDKPYNPLGETDDFCYKLGDGKLSADMSDFDWAYSLMYPSGGQDLPEAQFQALINVALDKNVGWRSLAVPGLTAQKGEAGARVVIMSTDDLPHMAGDVKKFLGVEFPANSGTLSADGDVDFECNERDYPSPDQVKTVLHSNSVHLVILTPNNQTAHGQQVVGAWKWVNTELLGQPEEYYQFISEDSSDLLDGVVNALKKVTEVACEQISTSTEPASPTTTQATQPTTTEATQPTTTEVVYPTEDSTKEETDTTADADTTESSCPEKPCNEGVVLMISNEPSFVNVTIH